MGWAGEVLVQVPPIHDLFDSKEDRAPCDENQDSGDVAEHRAHDCESPLVSAGRSEDRGRVVGTGRSALMANKATWKEDICRTAK